MARLNAVGDEQLHRNDEIRSTWRKLLADEDEFIYDGQAEINQQIAQRLQNEQASRSKGEVLATLLEEQMQSLARSELFVLCTMSIATKLHLEIQVLRNVKECDVRSCVAKAQSRRVVLSGYAERFLDKHWPGWGDIGQNGNFNRQYSQIIVEELAKLCKLGISKEDAKMRIKAQTYKRRTAKVQGLSITPALRVVDIKAVIAEITGVPLTQGAALKSHEKKAKGKKDTTYHPPSNHSKTDGPSQSKTPDPNQQPAVPSTNGNDASPHMPELDQPSDAASTDSYDADPVTPRSRQQTGTPDPELDIGRAPAIADDTATEIEVGRSEWRNLSGDFDSSPQSNGICSSGGASPSPKWHSSPVTEFGVIQPTSFQSLKRRALDSPMLDKRRRADEPQIHEQDLFTLGDSERLTGSFVNDVLQHYVVDRPEVYLVDSSELAKWDTTSYWNTPVQELPAARPEASEPKSPRRLKAQAAHKFIIPFHHPLQEHWTLWVALPNKDSGAWIFEHYDSLPRKSSDSSGELTHMENILRQYLGWLLQAPIGTVTAKVKVCLMLRKSRCSMYDRLTGDQRCALQADSVSCGIHLIANAIAVAQDSKVPQSVDRQLLRRELQGLLRKSAAGLLDDHDPSNETLQTISPLDGPSDNTDSRRPENPSILAPAPRDPSTDPTSDKHCNGQQPLNMPETHLIQAETELKMSNTNLMAFRKTLEDLEAQVAEAKTLHQKYSQQAAEALAKQKTADRNIEKIRNLEELPNADENDPSSTEIMARYCRSAERAKADKAEYEYRAQAALVQLKAFDKPLEDAKEHVVSGAMARAKAEKYVEHLRRFSGSGADG